MSECATTKDCAEIFVGNCDGCPLTNTADLRYDLESLREDHNGLAIEVGRIYDRLDERIDALRGDYNGLVLSFQNANGSIVNAFQEIAKLAKRVDELTVRVNNMEDGRVTKHDAQLAGLMRRMVRAERILNSIPD